MSSLWTENIEMPEFPTLEKDIRTQVLIIGGGMAGVLCAYFLQQAGVDYCLLEKDRICQGVTGHTTAKITAQHGLIYEKSLQSMGQERAELFLKANLRAVENYKSLGRFLDCDMEETDSYLYSVRERRKLESEIQHWAVLDFRLIIQRTRSYRLKWREQYGFRGRRSSSHSNLPPGSAKI